MRRIQDTNVGAGNLFISRDSGTNTPGTKIRRDHKNDHQEEICRAIESTGEGVDTTLYSVGDGNRDQLAQMTAHYGAGGASYFIEDATSAADAYVIKPAKLGIRDRSAPQALFENQEIDFIIGNTNTGASTLDVSLLLGEVLGTTIVNIKLKGGTRDPEAGFLKAGNTIKFLLRFNPGLHLEIGGGYITEQEFGKVFKSKSLAADGLVNLTAADAGRKIFITAKGEGDPFVVRYNATPGTYSDNGGAFAGTIFIPTGGDGTIALERNYSGSLHVGWFGAKGDGSTNDTASFQAALDSAESDLNSIKSVYAPAGQYLLDTIYIPLGVTLYGDGAIETTGRAATRLLQSTTNVDVIRFKSLLTAGNYWWYGKLQGFDIIGDVTNTVGFGINLKDISNNNVNFQDTSVVTEITVRRMPKGGVNLPSGSLPLTIGPMKLLFNNGPGISLTKTTAFQSIHLFDISGDGNNGGLLRFENLDNDDNIVITNIKSERRENADYGSADHQPNAIVCVNCDDAPIVINGASHISSVPDSGNFKKPGSLVQVTGVAPSLSWDGVSIRVRAGDTGSDPFVVGGLTGINPPPYTTPRGMVNSKFQLFDSVIQYHRIANADLDTTPSVAKGQVLLISNSAPTVITDFDDGVEGQVLILSFQDSNTTLTDGGNLFLAGGFVSTANDTLTLLRLSTGWREISRSVN